MTPADLHPKQPRAIHSALRVLEAVAAAGPGATVRQLVERLHLPRATVYRLVNVLVEDEYLVRLDAISGLALGSRVARFADSAGSARSDAETAGALILARPPRAARALLERLRSEAEGAAVHLFVYARGAPVPFDIDPSHPLADPRAMALDLDLSAAGRLLLAERANARPGLCAQSDLLARGRACAAVPLRAESGELVAALCAAGPSARMDAVLAAAHRNAAAADELAALLS